MKILDETQFSVDHHRKEDYYFGDWDVIMPTQKFSETMITDMKDQVVFHWNWNLLRKILYEIHVNVSQQEVTINFREK